MNTKGFFPAKFISITKLGANLQLHILCLRPQVLKKGGEKKTVQMQKESGPSCSLRNPQQSHKKSHHLNILGVIGL